MIKGACLLFSPTVSLVKFRACCLNVILLFLLILAHFCFFTFHFLRFNLHLRWLFCCHFALAWFNIQSSIFSSIFFIHFHPCSASFIHFHWQFPPPFAGDLPNPRRHDAGHVAWMADVVIGMCVKRIQNSQCLRLWWYDDHSIDSWISGSNSLGSWWLKWWLNSVIHVMWWSSDTRILKIHGAYDDDWFLGSNSLGCHWFDMDLTIQNWWGFDWSTVHLVFQNRDKTA